MPSLAFRGKNNIIVNEVKRIDDLDSLGFPAWDLIKPETYPDAPHGSFFKGYPFLPMIITRGCPYSCTFCGAHLLSGKKIRRRSIENVIAEIKFLKEKYGVKEIHIEDDNFTLDKDYVARFCNRLIEEKLDIYWCCPNGIRLDTLDKELLLLMKKSGLYSVSIGIESGSPRILKMVKKSLTPETIKEKVELIDSVGLKTIGFVMLGFPTETKEDIEQTIDFVCSLKLKRMNFSYLQPFPGTEIYHELLKKGEANKFSWKNCFLFRANYIPEGMTLEDLKAIRRKGLLRFYMKPRTILGVLEEIKSPSQLKFLVRRAYRWIFVE